MSPLIVPKAKHTRLPKVWPGRARPATWKGRNSQFRVQAWSRIEKELLESGARCREGSVAAVEDVVAQCGFAGKPVFVKQLGRRPVDDREGEPQPPRRLRLADAKGGDMAEWPSALRVRQWPRV